MFLCPWDSPGKNTEVGCHFLLQGNFSNIGIEPRSPALKADALLTELYRKPILYAEKEQKNLLAKRKINY